jgi:hypothetical protein
MLNQLASVSALAVETAENMPDVPEEYDTAFSPLGAGSGRGSAAAELESDPTIGNSGNEADDALEQGAAGEGAEQDRADKQDPADENAQHGGTDDEPDQGIDGPNDEHGGDGPDNQTPADKPEFARAYKS